MAKKIVHIMIDLDIYMFTLRVCEMSEQEAIDDQINEEGAVKEPQTFADFIKMINEDELENQDDIVKEEVGFGVEEITKMMDKVTVIESFGFADGEQGLGFYAVVEDEVNAFYDGQIEDYLEYGA